MDTRRSVCCASPLVSAWSARARGGVPVCEDFGHAGLLAFALGGGGWGGEGEGGEDKEDDEEGCSLVKRSSCPVAGSEGMAEGVGVQI